MMQSDNLSKRSEQELMELVQQQQPDALAVLYDRYAPALLGVVARMVKSDEVAEDVLQETFLKAWNNATSYDAAKGKLYTWLYNIARNTALDKIKSKQYRQTAQILASENIVHTIDAQHAEQLPTDTIGLTDVLQQLQPQHRQLIDLMYFEGYTQAEIADELNMPLGTVKTKLRQAVQHLRRLFA